ncbi:MAG: hypothetical protein KGQ40_16300, partial [Rhodospirillales bacterium]|nr:hypothetical protein [Rhodospirillales bacterium]
MIALLLGVVCLVALMTMLGMFSRAQIATLKSFGIWIAAIGGVALAAMLAFTKGPEAALAALVLLGPLVWSWMVPQSPRGRTHRPGRG